MTNADSNEIETIIITKNGKNITQGENLVLLTNCQLCILQKVFMTIEITHKQL